MLPLRASIRGDLRGAARGPVEKRALGDLLEFTATSPSGARLWLAERWPWTPGTEAALSKARPRWAVAVVDVDDLRPLARQAPEAAVRELNRAHDPWSPESRQLLFARSDEER